MSLLRVMYATLRCGRYGFFMLVLFYVGSFSIVDLSMLVLFYRGFFSMLDHFQCLDHVFVSVWVVVYVGY